MVKYKQWCTALILGGLGLGLAVSMTACSWQRSMRVAVVDTDRIVRENPKYMELNVLLAQERDAVIDQVPENVRSLSKEQKQELRKKLAKDATERSDKFSKMYMDFLKKLTEDIRGSAKEIAQDRHIDLVIVDSPSNPTVLYSAGENITTDILLKLKS